MNLSTQDFLPRFGFSDLEPDIAERYARNDPDFVRDGRLRCCIAGCQNWIQCRTKLNNDFCPAHRISISKKTYVHHQAQDNLIIGAGLLRNISKASNKLTNENSEDALTWNVFVALLALGELRQVMADLVEFEITREPELYLWGNRIEKSCCSPWPHLADVKKKLDGWKRQPTEIDIVLRAPGQVLIVIEAKFRSPNSRYDKKATRRGTFHEYLRDYPAKSADADPLDRAAICARENSEIFEQLCRNAIYADWLAEPGERVFVTNLVSRGFEKTVENAFQSHLAGERIAFRRYEWESISKLPVINTDAGEPLRRYLSEKTYNLKRAFPNGA